MLTKLQPFPVGRKYLYQAQKALLHATEAVKTGGIVILVAKCEEGVGSERFKETMMLGDTAEEVLEEFSKKDFYVGGHKAYLWAKSLLKARIILVADGITSEEAAVMKSIESPIGGFFYSSAAYSSGHH